MDMNIKERLDGIVAKAKEMMDASGTLEALNEVRVNILGKKGR